MTESRFTHRCKVCGEFCRSSTCITCRIAEQRRAWRRDQEIGQCLGLFAGDAIAAGSRVAEVCNGEVLMGVM